jgi:hypothetical protein
MIDPKHRKDLLKLTTQIEDIGPEVAFNLSHLDNYRYQAGACVIYSEV